MRFDIVTIFPDFFGSPAGPGTPASGILGHGVVSRALSCGIASVQTHDLRAFTHDRHRTVDDRPFGGGEGMVLKTGPIFDCTESLGISPKVERNTSTESVILLSAQGKRFTQQTARHLAALDRVVLICGRYEGVDERVAQHLCDDELSIGDYVLSGGELGAAIIIDAVVRLLPGVLGHADSSRYESFGEPDSSTSSGAPSSPRALARLGWEEQSEPHESNTHSPQVTNASGGLLDYPHYTRPADFRGAPIPQVLANGDHSVIRKWRRRAQLAKTLANRPDLLAAANLTEDDRAYLAALSQTEPK